MDIHFKNPTNKNYSLHNNLLSSVSTPRMVTHVPNDSNKRSYTKNAMFKSKI